MTLKELFALAGTLIFSLGGGASLVLALSSYLGKIWAGRILEQDRAKYQELNTELQHKLEIATRRLQVELDAVGLMNKLRTTEEFSHLGELWKKFATLNSTFSQVSGLGLRLVPANQEAALKLKEKLREDFLTSLYETQQFLYGEELYIPEEIAEVASKTLRIAQREPFLHNIYEDAREPSIRAEYAKEISGALVEFDASLTNLKQLMRAQVLGTRHNNPLSGA